MIPIKKVAILASPIPADANEDEKDSEVQVTEVREELSSWGVEVAIMPFTLNLSQVLKDLAEAQPDLVFNIVEAVDGHGRLIHLAPALLDVAGIPYTGAGTDATFLTSNKLLGKSALVAAGIPTARFFSLNDLKQSPGAVAGRYIIKSVWEHASIGLGQDSIVDVKNASELMEKMLSLQPRLSGECFAEAYIDGREFNLSVLAGPDGPQVLPPAEILFSGYPPEQFKIVDYFAKWKPDSPEYMHTPRSFEIPDSDAPLLQRLKSIALSCWHTFDLHGYARVDFRVDNDGNPFVLEVNTNPCLSKDAGFVAACQHNRIEYKELILRILEDTWNSDSASMGSSHMARKDPNLDTELPISSFPGIYMPTNSSLPSKILPQSKNDPRLEARPSPIHGTGVFATADIKAGEVLMVWGGAFFTPEDIQAGKAMEHSYCTIAEGLILGHTVEQGNSVDDHVNHSCDPNVWMIDEITVAARRDIHAGEEVTADLAMWWDPDDDPTPAWECRCGAPQCRKVFTGCDWRRPELYERYGDHFLPYINERIKRLRETKSEDR